MVLFSQGGFTIYASHALRRLREYADAPLEQILCVSCALRSSYNTLEKVEFEHCYAHHSKFRFDVS